ncbi:MAG: metallophosphoesterase [Clostridia bacterium]|nr:metallophosphoesterase [Clostridia bacterium]
MDKPILRFHPDGRFRVLMISDFHAGARFSPKLTAGIEALLNETSPDLVLIAGDQCMVRQTEEDLRAYFCEIIAPVLKRGLPWASVFGNHDRETGHDLRLEEAAYESIPGCLNEPGPEDVSGIGNYCLQILSSASDDVAFHIWALDSFSETSDYVRIFGLPENTRFILPNGFGDGHTNASPMFDQVVWYYNESLKRERAAEKKIPAIMYMHIPIQEFCLIERNPEETGARGTRREEVAGSELNSGLFMACLQRGDVKGIFCGHEHLNDFQGEYCGITLAYDGCIGYDMSAHDDLRGGRVIDLREDGTFTTYTVKLMDIMGRAAMRDPDYFEGGCNYHFRML